MTSEINDTFPKQTKAQRQKNKIKKKHAKTSIDKKMAVVRITDGREIADKGHAASHIVPQGPTRVHPHLALCHIRRHTEEGNPQILNGLAFKSTLDDAIESLPSKHGDEGVGDVHCLLEVVAHAFGKQGCPHVELGRQIPLRVRGTIPTREEGRKRGIK